MKPEMFNADIDLAWYKADQTPINIYTGMDRGLFAPKKYGIKQGNKSTRAVNVDVANKKKPPHKAGDHAG